MVAIIPVQFCPDQFWPWKLGNRRNWETGAGDKGEFRGIQGGRGPKTAKKFNNRKKTWFSKGLDFRFSAVSKFRLFPDFALKLLG